VAEWIPVRLRPVGRPSDVEAGMDDAAVAAYLTRIGVTGTVRPTADWLRELQARHVRSVPFENLDIHLGVPIVLTEQALLDKIVGRRRGGFCYELNGAFAALLRQLGFTVTLLAARVHNAEGILGPPLDHLALRVDTPEPWLVDVGFGRFSRHPLRLDSRAEQADPVGVFQIEPTADGDIDVRHNGRPQYRIEPRPRELADFEPTCWWQQTAPASHFTTSLTCSLPTDTGQVTLAGRRLIQTVGTDRRERVLATDAEVLAAYDSWFGIRLDRVPTVRPAGTGGALLIASG
jgi:N-hydroxyarylamine O-acetyltransferase